MALDLPALTQEAEAVVIGEVTRVQSAWDTRHETIYTAIDVVVAETWKGGPRTGETLHLLEPGGSLDGLELRVHGAPRFRLGERAVLFLRASGDPTAEVILPAPASLTKAWSAVGMVQGKRPLRKEIATGRWLVDEDNQGAVVSRSNDGRLRSVPPQPAVELSTLRARVRALLGGAAGPGGAP